MTAEATPQKDEWEQFVTDHDLLGELGAKPDPPTADPAAPPPDPTAPPAEGEGEGQPRDEQGRYAPHDDRATPPPAEGEGQPGEGEAPPPTPEPEVHRLDLTVAGKTIPYEMPRAAWDALGEEQRTDLVARLQKSEDYGRPGGALDKSAERKARDMLVEEGVLKHDPLTGTYQPTPEYIAWKNKESAPPTATPAPATQPPDTKSELDKLWNECVAGDDPAAYRQYYDRKAELEASAVEQRLLEQQQQRVAEANQRQEIQQIQAHLQARVEAELVSVKEQLADPQTHEIDPQLANLVRRTALAAITTDRNLESGLQVIRDFAAREATRNAAVRDFLAKANRPATPPKEAPPPAVMGGRPAAPKQEEEFDPNDPFGRKSGTGNAAYSRFAERYGLNQ